MGKGPRYRVPLKRRRRNKTDYRKRKTMVTSKIPRLVVRGSLRNMNVQVVEALLKGDRIMASSHSRELSDYGWVAPRGNLPAAYLTGLLLGLRAKAKGIMKAVPDIGLRSPSPGSRVFAAIKGARDAGLTVPCGNVLPKEERIRGEHIASYATMVNETGPELYKRRFSGYLSKGLGPDELPNLFEKIKSNILNSFNRGVR